MGLPALRIFVISLLPMLAAEALAKEVSIDSLCKSTENLSPPVEHLPGNREFNTLFGCESYRLYYGVGVTADPEQARKCAFIEVVDNEKVFGGASILMSIYANGKGVARNFDLAVKYACMSYHVPAERTAAIEKLLQYKKQNAEVTDFHVCNHITSGFMAGHCSALKRQIASMPRREALDAMISTWPAARRDAWQKLSPVVDEYINVVVENEVDMSGTARVALQLDEQERLQQFTYDLLQSLHQGRPPVHSPGVLLDADASLNTAYKAVQQLPDHQITGTITRETIRRTQETWLRYRDAWTQFTKDAFPDISADSVRARLTLIRLDILKRYLQ